MLEIHWWKKKKREHWHEGISRHIGMWNKKRIREIEDVHTIHQTHYFLPL